MNRTITVKHDRNILLTIIGFFALLLLSVIILLLLLSLLQNTDGMSFTSRNFEYYTFRSFFILFLYLWLWNTVSKTEIKVSANFLTIIQHKKLFSKPKNIDFDLIKKVFLEYLTIEKAKEIVNLIEKYLKR